MTKQFQFWEEKFEKSLADTKRLLNREQKKETENNLTKKTTKKQTRPALKKEAIGDVENVVKENTESSMFLENITDSIPEDSLFTNTDEIGEDTVTGANFNEHGEEEEIIVKKDELISSVKLDLLILDSLESISPKDDSLLSAISGIRKRSNEEAYTVEFWVSPINYKGYKMANNKLVIFGLNEDYSQLRLINYNKKIFLHHNSSYYQIDHTFVFRQFHEINDQQLLQRIKE